jgi:predicted MPP superfamily phosphohydrolase
MSGRTINMAVFIAVIFIIDLYVLNGLKGLSIKWKLLGKKFFRLFYLAASVVLTVGLLIVIHVKLGLMVRIFYIIGFFVLLIFKVCFAVILLIDDLRRLLIYTTRKLKKPSPVTTPAEAGSDIPRSEFLLKAGLLAGAVPLAALKLSMKSGLYDYHVKRHQLYLENLPKAFDGLRLAQISDIHSGSFFDKKAVLGGVEMLLKEKPDLVFFTGDIVNGVSEELNGYLDIFSKVKAPLGVFSTLGNHDYGDYANWATPADQMKDRQKIVKAHEMMGWDLIRNSNRRLKVDGEEIGILGMENWGELSRFPKYGRMDLTVKNTDDLPVKLLLSHDPSHWRAQVLPQYPQIDMVFAGHTHGMQMGIQTEHFQWSPVEYIYNEWAGFYREGKQQLYVNVGYGFLGFRGRVGILPEITIFTLKAGTDPRLSKA